MKERKESIETFIKEELAQEAKDILKENEEDIEGQSMPDGVKERIWQNIQEEIAGYEKEKSYHGLSDEDYLALRLGQEMLEKREEEKKSARKKRGKNFIWDLPQCLFLWWPLV